MYDTDMCPIAAEQQQAALEKPFDLFKAIFENEDDPSSEDEGSDTEKPPEHAEPPPAAVPASAASSATLPDSQGQSHQQTNAKMETPAAVTAPPAGLSSLQSEQGSDCIRPSQQHVSGTPGGLSDQAAAPEQAPVGLQPFELGSRPSSGKRRKLKGEEKEKSHKKKSKKEKDKKRSGANAASDVLYSMSVSTSMRISSSA